MVENMGAVNKEYLVGNEPIAYFFAMLGFMVIFIAALIQLYHESKYIPVYSICIDTFVKRSYAVWPHDEYYATYQYVYNDAEYVSTIPILSLKYKVGEQYKLYVNPKNPKKCHNSIWGTWVGAIISFAMCVCFLVEWVKYVL